MRIVVHGGLLAAIAVATLSPACSRQVKRVYIDPQRLRTEPMPALTCGYRLTEVVDGRPAGERIGGLGRHQLMLEDAPTLVKGQLLKAGLSADAPAGAAAVKLEIKRLYLIQSQTSKVPVAVYQVSLEGAAPFLIRASKASVNWNGSEDEAYTALGAALQDANQQLLVALNGRCPHKG
ncbi:hypothetical protein [Lysobacter antibioticus]|uniref:hypothetical protein n=1 Tax=Lysobacter antibioticus TaxID=84531 RepID=UPI000A69EE0C|nr:hypothetical protein [Lysobacter antibioticus]